MCDAQSSRSRDLGLFLPALVSKHNRNLSKERGENLPSIFFETVFFLLPFLFFSHLRGLFFPFLFGVRMSHLCAHSLLYSVLDIMTQLNNELLSQHLFPHRIVIFFFISTVAVLRFSTSFKYNYLLSLFFFLPRSNILILPYDGLYIFWMMKQA